MGTYTLYHIHHYTGAWQAALNPTPPEAGDSVEVSDRMDEMEWHDFNNILKRNRLHLVWRDWDDDDMTDTYDIESLEPEA